MVVSRTLGSCKLTGPPARFVQTRDSVANRMEGEDRHPRLSSDFQAHAVALECQHTHRHIIYTYMHTQREGGGRDLGRGFDASLLVTLCIDISLLGF